MKHFTYQIDEQSLRSQLKNLAVPFNEISWTKFENYSDAQAPLHISSKRFRDFQLNVNRNVVVPIVFGAVVISFSFLLFNFISIKNPTSVKTVAPSENVEIRLPELSAHAGFMVPVAPSPIVLSENKVVAVKVADTEIVEEKPIASTTSSEKLNLEGTANVTSRKTSKAKSPEQDILSTIRPDVIIEDTDPEIRPN